MHRVRTWARAKAHGRAPWTSEPGRNSSRATPAPAPQPQSAAAAAAEPATDASPANTEAQPCSTDEKATRPATKNVFVRFYGTLKDILFSSGVNVLLVFVPIGIAVRFAGLSAAVVFSMNAIAIVPLAGLLSHATESVASRLGDTIGALMNVTFGNAVELIIFIIALIKNEFRIVQASLLGSILANLLLILGMCFLFGGLRFREQIYNSTITQTSSCLLSLSVISLLLPTAFHASFSDELTADAKVLQVSRGTSVVLLLVYVLYLLFQLNSHAYMYESTPQHIIDREMVPGPAAQYFDSSSSSSSGSDTDGSERSNSTAKRIKRMMKRKRTRKHSSSSQQTSKIQSPAAESVLGDELGPSSSQEVGVADGAINGVIRLVPIQAVSEDAPDGDARPEKARRKKDKKRKQRMTDDVDPDPVQPNVLTETGETRRIDFAVMVDVEAQDTRPRPFSLRVLRPQIPKTFSQNVFTTPSPAQPALQTVPRRPSRSSRGDRRLRRATTTPAMPGTATTPGAVPAIVPIVVNTTPKTTGVIEGDDAEVEDTHISRTTAVVLLLVSTGLVALCAEFMVDSISAIVGDDGNSGVSEAFIGLILLPIVGNAAEHVTAVTVAMKNKMDLAISVALGSSIQIAIFVTPLIVILGWIMNKDMTLYFTLFETVTLFASTFIVNFLVLDGRSNYLEGALLCSAYIIIAVAAFFFPPPHDANGLGGGNDKPSNETNATVAVVVGRALLEGMGNLMSS